MPQVQCTACAKNLKVPDAAVGKKVKCPKCGHVFVVPNALSQVKSPVPVNDAVGGPSVVTLPPSKSVIADAPTNPPGQASDATLDQPVKSAADLMNPSLFLSPPQSPDEIGRLGQYRILEVLGQ